MTNQQILNLAAGLSKISPPDMTGDFNYAISANRQEAERVAINIQAAIKDSKEMAEYRKKLQDLQIKHARKDKNNEPAHISIPQPDGSVVIQYEIPSAKDPNSEFNKKAEELTAEYKQHIDEQNERIKFLSKENTEFDIFPIEKKDIPKGLGRDQMDLIFPLVRKDG